MEWNFQLNPSSDLKQMILVASELLELSFQEIIAVARKSYSDNFREEAPLNLKGHANFPQ